MAIQNVFSQFARGFPITAGLTGLAAVTLPFAMRTENRGYFKTAALTMPFIAAAGMAAPTLIPALRKGVGERVRFADKAVGWLLRNSGGLNYRSLRSFVESGDIGSEVIRSAVSEVLPGQAISWLSQGAAKTSVSIADRAASIRGLIEQMSTRNQMWQLSYAFERTRLNSLSPIELSGEENLAVNIPAPFTKEDVMGRLEAAVAAGNEGFLETLEGRLRYGSRLADLGPQAEVMAAAGPVKTTITKRAMDTIGDKTMMDLLYEQRREVWEILNKSERLKDAQFVATEMATGPKLLRIKIKMANLPRTFGEFLPIPLLDKATGTVHIGDNYRAAAGRGVWSPIGGTHRTEHADLDVWLASHLNASPEDLARVLDVAPVGSLDKLNTWKWENMPGEQTSTLLPDAILRYHRQYIVDPRAVFEGNRRWGALTNAERLAYKESALADTGWASPITAEHSYLEGTLGARELEASTFGRMAPWRGQSQAMRAFNKPLHYANVDEELLPYVGLSTEASRQEVRQVFSAISPQESVLFGGLPNTTEQLRSAETERKALETLRFSGYSEEQAQAVWNATRSALMEPGALQAARLAGGLGETETILRPGQASQIPTVAQRWVTLDTVNIPFYNEITPNEYGPDQVIGRLQGAEIVSEAPTTRLLQVNKSISGRLEALLEEVYPSETGDKLNVGGVKITTIEPEAEEFDLLQSVINAKRRAAGETEIPDVATALVNNLFFHEKIKEPAELLAQQGAAIYKEMEAIAAEGEDPFIASALETYRNAMASEHISYTGKRFMEETQMLANMTYDQLRDRQLRLLRFNEDLANAAQNYVFVQRGRIARFGGVLGGFARSNETDLLNYSFYNALSAGTSKWASARRWMPNRTSLTFEMYGQLQRGGLVETLRSIQGRATFEHGAIKPAADIMNYISAGNFTSQFGSNVYDFATAVPANLSLGTLSGRKGVFDFTDTRFKDPFSIRLPNPIDVEVGRHMVRHEYLPVLGWGSYGGGPNRGAPNEAFATDYEQSLLDVISAAKDPAGARYGDAFRRYEETLSQVAFGKKGAIFRPMSFDPMAISGAAEQIMTESPFDVMISEEFAERFGAETRAALRSEGVYGIITRHPIQATLPIRVRMAQRNTAEWALLGRRGIGISKQLAGGLEADFDLDTLNIHLMSHHESAATAELREAILNPESTSNMYLNTINMMYANADDSAMHRMGGLRRGLKEGGYSSVWRRLFDPQSGVFREVGNFQTAAARESARYIPQFSNMVTMSQLMLGSHPALASRKSEVALLENILWLPRQAAIGAVKGSQNVAEQATQVESLLQRMRGGLEMGTAAGAQQYLSGLKQVAKSWKWQGALTPRTASYLFGISEEELATTLGMPSVDALRQAMADREHFNIVQHIVESKRVEEGITTLIQHPYGQEVGNLSRLLTTASERVGLESMQFFRQLGDVAPELQALSRGETRGVADLSARILGTVNKDLAAGRKVISSSLKGSLPVLGVGLGIAALAGAMIGPRMGTKSLSAYRPEVALATTDTVPGEPISGQMAPVNPPRRVIPAAPMTRTSVVTPVRQSVDLEVRAPSGDRGRAAELERVISQVAGGGTTLTNVNFVNGHKRLSTMRMRQKVQEMLGED